MIAVVVGFVLFVRYERASKHGQYYIGHYSLSILKLGMVSTHKH